MHKVIRILSILVVAEFLLPIAFKHLPFPLRSHYFWQTIWFISLLFNGPRIFFAKPLRYVYVGLFYFSIFFAINIFEIGEIEYPLFVNHFLDMLFALSVYNYYLSKNDKNGLSLFIKACIIFIVLSCITSLIGFKVYPESIRFSPNTFTSTPEESKEMSRFFISLGIMTYGFFYGLAMSIPMFYLWLKKRKTEIKKTRVIYILAVLIIIYGIIKSNYATAFLIMLSGLILSQIGPSRFKKYRFIIFPIIVIFLFVPNTFYVELILKFSNFLEDGSTLQKRIVDLGMTISGEEDTHVSGRLDRIPILIEKFFTNPIFGSGFSSGHNFILDVLSSFGIVGIIPYFIALYSQYKFNKRLLPQEHLYYYKISILLFLIYTPFKGAPGYMIYFFVFLIVPGISFLIQRDSNIELSKNLMNKESFILNQK